MCLRQDRSESSYNVPMNYRNFTGWDIGGAHLKVASASAKGELDYIDQFATPLWLGLDRLERILPDALQSIPSGPTCHAVTMTAELVDIFTSRQQGLQTVQQLCQQYLGEDIAVYASNSGFQQHTAGDSDAGNIASANWHASASYVAMSLSDGLFIDIGSTTTDIIPFRDGRLLNLGDDDRSRLQHSELVYSGVIRTPLMALAKRVPFLGEWHALTAEQFATTADIYRILGHLGTDVDLMDTADGAGKDINASIRRLARMIGCDAEHYPDRQAWLLLARYFAEAQLQQLMDAVQHVLSRYPESGKKLVAAGAGCFLVKELASRLQFEFVEFSDLLGCHDDTRLKCNICAPAVALAQLNRLQHTHETL